jgi:hypothetical protein
MGEWVIEGMGKEVSLSKTFKIISPKLCINSVV